mgnify:CR=1 FL=1
MLLKKEPAYRKAEKEDFPLIREFIRRNYKDRWEFEEAHTEKRLCLSCSRLLEVSEMK